MQLYIFIGIIIVILSVLYYNMKSKGKFIKSLNESFGHKPKDYLEDFDMTFLKNHYELRKKNEAPSHPIDELTWNDLDMDTVFKRINYTKTSLGEAYLYYKLKEINYNEDEWTSLENLTNLFTTNEELRNKVSLLLLKVGKLIDLNLTNFIYNPKFSKIPSYYKYPLLSLGFIFSILLSFIYTKVGLILSFIFLCINILSYQSEKIFLEDRFKVMIYLLNNINLCRSLSKIKDKDFEFFRNEISSALHNFKALNRVKIYGNSFQKNENSFTDIDIIFDYIKMFFMVDIVAYQNSVKILEKNKENLYKIYNIVAKLDFALSLAYYRKSLSEYTIPEFIESEDIVLENLYHPLIDNPVKNSILIKNNILFTGSNASGKSTFIKAVALNCILAQSLNTALCSKYRCKFSNVVTSMAIKDNILSGDSYFIAEIKSLKRLLDSLNGEIRVLAFVDEILKGTNTIERISASASILKYAESTNGRLLVATHDMELTQILETYENYHFSETVTEDEVTFDYKLKKGPSNTRNALKLLKAMNFNNEVVSLSNQVCNNFIETEKWGKL
ncbi:MutS-related protein [Clostridium perfringens]|uniref:DNA mismatch repair protein MutS n=7 Tax=Clostridium perfringens TaxID=1502 RepID=A0AAP6WNL2_CLOPF|nr:DNA mismatch repair protein MutS [Clostridium perfringens]EDT22708.1 MutS domain V protein [Clostridium perfringens B str. ATCC 3626]MCX0355194.1 DNA mismatch repair protein MutS [Clostridium perfringens]MDM0611015.1 DNA mismatch repair protein MutS [Clostridium perfringens]MDZ5014739.1 DNA mismatch repair protein MutS [Clostridium perfringens]NGU30056.1 DNA mismatch repair protein MutS [Clostridium perfringens]